MTDAVIMWFRNDLRLADNPALHAAATAGLPVIPLFILDDDAAGHWRAGGASRWWLHGRLAALADSLEAINSRLILARGATRDILPRIAKQVRATTVHCARAYEPWAMDLET